MPSGGGHAVQFVRYTDDGQGVVVVNPWNTAEEEVFDLSDVYLIAHGVPPFESTEHLVADKIDDGSPVNYEGGNAADFIEDKSFIAEKNSIASIFKKITGKNNFRVEPKTTEKLSFDEIAAGRRGDDFNFSPNKKSFVSIESMINKRLMS